ncbi:MAG: hypothetical protein J0H40_00085 [Rhizobiales bacterium]|nr:hypothetical protein [Hyphomicrobiales bacterium]
MAENAVLIYVALAVIGFLAGLTVRLPTLLLVLSLVLLFSILSAVNSGLGVTGTTVTIVCMQTIVQASYFIGLVAKAAIGTHRIPHL